MNAPIPSTAGEKPLSVETDVEAAISKLVEQTIPKHPPQIDVPKHPPQIETDAERIRSSVARLTSNSVDSLEGLMSELQDLHNFLNSEVQRVQGEIESVLAGIKIIIETIAPWRSATAPPAPAGARAIRAGPAANLDIGQPRR
jgi:hypothetical protein